MANRKKKIPFNFGDKHKAYIRACATNMYNVAEGAVRAGKTVDNIFAFAYELKKTKDRIHLATGSTVANAKLNIGDANGFGLEYIFRGQCRWSKYKDNEALIIKGVDTKNQERIVIFAGGAKADSYKKIRGNSYGMWIATEINLHHDNTIKEAFNRTAAAQMRKFFWDLNPDHPKAKIYTDYIDKYQYRQESGQLLGGYNYEHFTIDDNVNISEARRLEIKSQYDVGSVWYNRDILGLRMVAEGLIYRQFTERKQDYLITELPNYFEAINIGIDIGGTNSHHAIVATGLTRNYEKLIALKSERIDPNGTPEDLNKHVIDFIYCLLNNGFVVDTIWFESAEQVLKRGLIQALSEDKKLLEKGINISVVNSIKNKINDRIGATAGLIAQSRFFYNQDCESLIEALTTCVWDPKILVANERLDDGTSDIDTLDAFEYSFEKYIKAMQFVDKQEEEVIECY